MGLIQIVAGLLRLDLLMRFVSRSVITGFVNAFAILIFLAQPPRLTGVGNPRLREPSRLGHGRDG